MVTRIIGIFRGIPAGSSRVWRTKLTVMPAMLLCLCISFSSSAFTLNDNGYERLTWGMSVDQVKAILDRDFNSPGALQVRKRNAINSMIEEFKEANPGYKPPSVEDYDDDLDAEDFRVNFDYEEVANGELRPQYFLKELGTEIEIDTGEGVIALTNDEPKLFYCFIEGKLWKVVEIHEDPVVKEDISFTEFVQRLTKKLGMPDKKEYAAKPGSARRELILARWNKKKTEIHARPMFSKFLLVFQARDIAAKIDRLRADMRSLKQREDSGDSAPPPHSKKTKNKPGGL
ncbi:MAG: hypothetical protein GXP49_17535 [Deltaproteobacteria bacterium]|nr:hypothetical protein [Deltaproteobacteria bacterium]